MRLLACMWLKEGRPMWYQHNLYRCLATYTHRCRNTYIWVINECPALSIERVSAPDLELSSEVQLTFRWRGERRTITLHTSLACLHQMLTPRSLAMAQSCALERFCWGGGGVHCWLAAAVVAAAAAAAASAEGLYWLDGGPSSGVHRVP